MLPVVDELVADLASANIRYCHWKSNWALAEGLRGDGDLDLLVDRRQARRFRSILTRLGFRSVVAAAHVPGVEHFYAMDASGRVAHVHAYYRIITGQSLAKNYRLPIEDLLLDSTRDVDGIRVPRRGAELITFVIRMSLKHTSPAELLMLRREAGRLEAEIAWLLDDASLAEAVELLPAWLPQIDTDFFERAVQVLAHPNPQHERVVVGLAMQKRLRQYARRGLLVTEGVEIRLLLGLVARRLRERGPALVPATGGAVIAFVGSEASGKSTHLSEIAEWLRKKYSVRSIRIGQPPSSALSVFPNMAVPLLRKLFPGHRSGEVEARAFRSGRAGHTDSMSLLFAVRSALIARDRRRVLVAAHAAAAKGMIILCDRYPSTRLGAVDSAQLADLISDASVPAPFRWLARYEVKQYRDIPPPDLLLQLSAPLDVILSRNVEREKVEPEAYVRMRHARMAELQFGEAPVLEVDTNRPHEETLAQIKQAVWSVL